MVGLAYKKSVKNYLIFSTVTSTISLIIENKELFKLRT